MKFSVIYKIFVLLMLLGFAGSAAAAPDAKLTVKLDSAYLLMGRATPLHINLLTNNPEGQILIPKDTLNSKVEILKLLDADTTNHGNGRIEINRDILLQSFDSGDYRLAPILYVQGGETISSNRLMLRVLPVMKDSIELHDFTGVSDPDRKWYDYLPDFLVDHYIICLIILALLIAGGLGGYWYYRHRRQSGKPKVELPKLSPYDQAVTDLNLLREKKLCEKGYEKQYYSDLTEILRVYLYRRFGINAMEMTSSEILKALYSNPETRLPRKYMDQVLEMADFVKFAKMRPLPDDNVRSFDSAMKFVEDTKPVPVAEQQETDGEKNDTPNPEK